MATIAQAQLALKNALATRRALGLQLSDAICPYDAAVRQGLEVRFVDLPSIDAIYLRADTPHILISCHRPAGRKAFSCAHELGHHVFGHSCHVDQLFESEATLSRTDEERVADLFAGYFLMPKTTVVRKFNCLNVRPNDCDPVHALIVAGWLGVGYTSLIHHLAHSLNLLDRNNAERLLDSTARMARRALLGSDVATDVVLANEAWTERPIDLQVGDFLVLPADAQANGRHIAATSHRTPYNTTAQVFEARTPGIERVSSASSAWTAFVRVSRRNYVGLVQYRHMEES